MSTVSLESRSNVDAPLEAAVEATPFPQKPTGAPMDLTAQEGLKPFSLSMFSQESMRPTLETFAALKPQPLEQLLPALGILGLAVVAGVGLRLTAAVLGSIDELPMLGRLLQLVGLVTAIQFLSRNAMQQQQRAALLARIQKLKLDVMG